MSDVVRAKLAEALRQHGDSSLATWANERICLCDCMYRVMPPGPDFCDHLADVLLSLEGVTIVALPEPSGINGADNRVWHPHGFYVEQEFNGDVVINDRLAVCADELRALAAVLLAAADAAEAVTDA